MTEGFVYILKNEAMPRYLKIGMTQQDDVAARVRQLDNTSTPLPFECIFVARVPDCRSLERTLHFVFGDRRVRANREFFEVDAAVVRAVIELVAIKEAPPSDREQGITPDQRRAIEESRSRVERTNLQRLGIEPGAVLTFSKDPDITCEVAGPRTVKFRGVEQSLSQAALTVIRELGYSWNAISGPEYWTYGGVKLSALKPPPSEE